MYYSAIKKCDVANGTGVRVSLFVSGCTHHCKGCFNPETWNFENGKPYTQKTTEHILELLKPDYISGLSILGGEPFEPQNQNQVIELCKKVKDRFPHKDIWCWTGYTLEDDILSGRLGKSAIELLHLLDYLVDGEFVESEKNITLKFRGSENQRIIYLRKCDF